MLLLVNVFLFSCKGKVHFFPRASHGKLDEEKLNEKLTLRKKYTLKIKICKKM